MESALLEHVPVALLGVAVVGLTAGLAVAGLLAVRRRVAASTLQSHREVAGYVFAVIGVVYGVLLAFVVVVVWEEFELAEAVADEEAAYVADLYLDAVALGRPGDGLRRAVEQYATSVAEVEWERMAKDHIEDRATDAALDRVWDEFRAVAVTDFPARIVQEQAGEHLHELTRLRRERIFHSTNTLPGLLWFVLVAGAVVCIGFTYFFAVPSVAAQVLMVGALGFVVGLVLFVILCLNLPFTGDLSVGPTSMRDVIAEFAHHADDGAP